MTLIRKVAGMAARWRDRRRGHRAEADMWAREWASLDAYLRNGGE